MSPIALNRQFFLTIALVALFGSMMSGNVWADILTLDSEGAGANVTITYTNSSMSGGGYTLTGFAGQNNLSLNNGSQFNGFCVDLSHFVSVGQSFKVNPSSTSNLTNGAQIAYLVNTFGSKKLTNAQAAGLQIAIWSELYDNGEGFASGNFQYLASQNSGDPNYSAIASAAATYLADANGQSSSSTWYDASQDSGGLWSGQSMVYPDPPPPPSIPEPSMLSLFSIILLCLGAVYGWRRKLTLRGFQPSL
jgi:hypothetical protein